MILGVWLIEDNLYKTYKGVNTSYLCEIVLSDLITDFHISAKTNKKSS